MTIITLIDIDGRRMRIASLHYRDALPILMLIVAGKPVCLENHPVVSGYIDGGYLLIDRDRKTVLSRQDCFPVTLPLHLPWNVIDLSL